MVRGENMCEIEENTVCGLPDFFQGMLMEYPEYNEFLHFFRGQMNQNTVKERKLTDYGSFNTISPTAGGIDPKTGYTRRVMNRFAGFDFSAPITIQQVPNLTKYIAGDTGYIVENFSNSDTSINYGYITFIFTLVFTILILIFFNLSF